MVNLKKVLTEEEIEQIELIKEMCEGLNVDDGPVICFEILSKLINEETKIDEISRSTLIICDQQLKEYNRFWEDVIWFDNRNMEKIIPKIRDAIKSHLNSHLPNRDV